MKKILLLANSIFASLLLIAQSPVVQSTLIFPLQNQHVHASSLVALPNGDFLVAWFQGSGERMADDVRIMGARLPSGSKSWSSPFLMADTRDLPDCNPVLFLNRSGKLFLVWIAVQANRWEESILRVRTATDFIKPGPPNWSWQDNILLKPSDSFPVEIVQKFQQLPAPERGWSAYAPRYDELILEAAKDPGKRSTGWMTRIKPLITQSGRILLPLYSDGFNMSLMAVSDDDGESWRPGRPLVGRGPIQPALAQRKNGRIIALMRDSGDPPNRVQTSESTDNGESWAPAQKTEIPNTASVELLVMQNGYWAFVGNDIDDGRYQLSLYLSDDEGKTWKYRTRLESAPKDQGSFSYPSLLQTKDGMLHITYSYHLNNKQKSIKYIVVDPGKIIGR